MHAHQIKIQNSELVPFAMLNAPPVALEEALLDSLRPFTSADGKICVE